MEFLNVHDITNVSTMDITQLKQNTLPVYNIVSV